MILSTVTGTALRWSMRYSVHSPAMRDLPLPSVPQGTTSARYTRHTGDYFCQVYPPYRGLLLPGIPALQGTTSARYTRPTGDYLCQLCPSYRGLLLPGIPVLQGTTYASYARPTGDYFCQVYPSYRGLLMPVMPVLQEGWAAQSLSIKNIVC
jgi:hypothetical protein